MKIESLINAIGLVEDDHKITRETIVEALAEGLEKAYRKHINCPDAVVRVEVTKKGDIHVYQVRTVVEDVDDDEIEIALEDAVERKADVKVGDTLEDEVSIQEFGRSTITLFKNVMLQKLKEATKQVIYNEYIDKVDDLVEGVVETVEDKFVLINLGKTLALMQKSEQIPYEEYKDGQRIKVVIKEVNKDSKGSQVIVSRSSATLVKRLFEQKVADIYSGTVEIKAIAREANERTKMAVVSKDPNVDPVGACIGPKGQRVVSVLEEISNRNNPNSHENIDIVLWSPNLVDYVKEVLKPAEILAVVPNEETNSLLIVVEDNKLSLAIGRKGINARLAVKLLNKKIDIKTKSQVEELGIDYMSEMAAYEAKETARRRVEEANKIAEAEAARQLEIELAKQAAEEAKALEAEKAIEEAAQTVETVVKEPEVIETVIEEVTPVVEEVVETPVVVEQEVKETVEAKEEESEKTVAKRRKTKVTVQASEYVSKFETLADVKKEEKTTSNKKKKFATKEELEAQEVNKQLEALKNKEYEIKPEYSEEELEAFNNAEDDHWYDDDVDYDEYDEYYEN